MSTKHTLTVEPQPIADQVAGKCACGWRTFVSVHQVVKGLPSDVVRDRHREHLKYIIARRRDGK